MRNEQYIRGKGADTSQEHTLKKTKHLYKEADNLYTLYPALAFESLDFLYNKEGINQNKFGIVLLTEWIKYLALKGHLILSFTENEYMNKNKFSSIYTQFLARYMNIKEFIQEHQVCTVVLQKKKTMFPKNDTIDKWTFGMITVGKRNEWVDKFIESIRAQNIPHYEIILIGLWDQYEKYKEDKKIQYIEFTQKLGKGWITKKKNMIFKRAKYNNVLILHDRFMLDAKWYAGMKTYGNCWDALFFPIVDKTGKEYVHWTTWGSWVLPIGYADIRDWGTDYYAGGTFMAIKKHIWKEVPLDEKRLWAEQEDAEHGLRFTKKGFVIRANKDATLHTFVTYVHDAPIYEFNPYKLGKPVEYRGKKWIFIQRFVDVCTRLFGLSFLRVRRKASLFLKKLTNKVAAPDIGGKRD